MPIRINPIRSWCLSAPVIIFRLVAASAAVAPLQNDPPAKIVIDPPQADRLARGVAFIQYHAENRQIEPAYGTAALAVSPRLGHIHVSVDDAIWHWADASGNPIILQDLAPGPHKVLIELVNANHPPVDKTVVTFTIPGTNQLGSHH